MKKLFFALFLALSSVVGVQGAWAVTPSGDKFCHNGMGLLPDFQRKMDASLAADPSGGKALEGCNGTPKLFLQAWQNTKTGANLKSVGELPAFLRKLKKMDVDRTETFVVSCLWRTANGWQVKMKCDTRTLVPGEEVYGDPTTREMLIMSSCANPGVAYAPPIVVTASCLEVRFPPMGKNVAIRFAYIGPQPLPGRCNAITLAGETQRRLDMPEECPDTYDVIRDGRKVRVVCSWSADEQAVSEKLGEPMRVQNVSGSFYARVPEGVNHWYLPVNAKEGMPVICWEFAPGQSKTLGVTADMFVDGVATITPDHVRNLSYAGN